MRFIKDIINFKDALICYGEWGINHMDLDKDDYLGCEDIFYLEFGNDFCFKWCLIDLGYYLDCFCINIFIADKNGSLDNSWSKDNELSRIVCFSVDDMLIQLQRAIDIYPEYCKKLVQEKRLKFLK